MAATANNKKAHHDDVLHCFTFSSTLKEILLYNSNLIQDQKQVDLTKTLSDRRPMVGDPNWNTVYKKHLQQVITQQQMRQSFYGQNDRYSPPLPPPAPRPAQQVQRGKLNQLSRNRISRNSSNVSTIENNHKALTRTANHVNQFNNQYQQELQNEMERRHRLQESSNYY